MWCYIKSCESGVARNGSPFLKMDIITEKGESGKATCFTSKFTPGSAKGRIVMSSINLNAEYPNITEGELGLSFAPEDISSDVRKLFKPYLPPHIPSLQEFKGAVTALLPDKSPEFDAELGDLYEKYSLRFGGHSVHHNYPGGLLLHVVQVLNIVRALHESGLFPHEFNPYVCGVAALYHDYGKIWEYDEEGNYQESIALEGHVFTSARWFSEHGTHFPLTEDEKRNVIHCILSHHGKKEWGSPVEPATIEAFILHHADMLSGHGEVYARSANMERQFILGGGFTVRLN